MLPIVLPQQRQQVPADDVPAEIRRNVTDSQAAIGITAVVVRPDQMPQRLAVGSSHCRASRRIAAESQSGWKFMVKIRLLLAMG